MAVTEDPRGVRVLVGLGSNLDDPRGQVARALRELDAIAQTRVVRHSSLYRSEPWGLADQPAYVNAAAELATALDARALLSQLLAIERAHGRRRDGTRWGPRTLDLDLLAYDDLRIDEPELVLPHPRLGERAFVLMPLAEIDPTLEIVGIGPVRALLARLDTRGCERLDDAA